ncbi:MAG: RDD family protein [Candidatus Korobacteraceae bacterium]
MTEQPLHTPLEESGVPDVWRNEVQDRLERYKRRRGRRIEGAFTMRFPFPPEELAEAAPQEEDDAEEPEQFNPPLTNLVAATENAEPSPALLEQPGEEVLAEKDLTAAEAQKTEAEEVLVPLVTAADPPAGEPEPEEEEEPARLIELPPRPLPRRKVIAFPSPSYAQSEAVRRIADPVQPEQLRILDVPEELQAMQATPFLEGLLDAPPAFAPDVRSDGLELPCAPLRAPRRIGAASIDALVTLAGVGVCAAGAARFFPTLPPTKYLVAAVLAVSVLLWASYNYLFLVYRGRTLGMTATHVRLRTFKGRFPDFRQRQLRVVGLYLSVLSLGMGVLWYFVDVESLCWHDRISQTFPAAADKS